MRRPNRFAASRSRRPPTSTPSACCCSSCSPTRHRIRWARRRRRKIERWCATRSCRCRLRSGRRAAPAGIPADLDAICLRALEKAPDDRYPTAAELRADLQRHLADLPIEARVPTATYRLRKFVRRIAPRWSPPPLLAALLAHGRRRGDRAGAARRARARACRRRAPARRTALAESESVTDFMIGLFESQDPSIAMGAEPSARELIERGRQRAQLLTEQPLVRARMLDSIGRVYHGIGGLRRARNRCCAKRSTFRQRAARRLARRRRGEPAPPRLAAPRRAPTPRPSSNTRTRSALRRELLGPRRSRWSPTRSGATVCWCCARATTTSSRTTRSAQAVDILRAHFGDDHPSAQPMLNTLAAVPDARGDHARQRAAAAPGARHPAEAPRRAPSRSSSKRWVTLRVHSAPRATWPEAKRRRARCIELERRVVGPIARADRRRVEQPRVDAAASGPARRRRSRRTAKPWRRRRCGAWPRAPDDRVAGPLPTSASVLTRQRAFRGGRGALRQRVEPLRARLGDNTAWCGGSVCGWPTCTTPQAVPRGPPSSEPSQLLRRRPVSSLQTSDLAVSGVSAP